MNGRPKAKLFSDEGGHAARVEAGHVCDDCLAPEALKNAPRIRRLAVGGLEISVAGPHGCVFAALDAHWVFFTDRGRSRGSFKREFQRPTFGWIGLPSQDLTNSEAAKAVQSIQGYVERCNLFMVLTPELFHGDTGLICNSTSWQSRGWYG